jgi:hypothetical protein
MTTLMTTGTRMAGGAEWSSGTYAHSYARYAGCSTSSPTAASSTPCVATDKNTAMYLCFSPSAVVLFQWFFSRHITDQKRDAKSHKKG